MGDDGSRDVASVRPVGPPTGQPPSPATHHPPHLAPPTSQPATATPHAPATPHALEPTTFSPKRELEPDAALLQNLKALWTRLLEASIDSRRLRVLLADLTPESVSPEELVLVPHPSVTLAANTLRAELQTLVLRVTGRRLAITYKAAEPAAAAAVDQPALPTVEAMSAHPLVKQALELTGGKVIGVQPRKRS